MAFILDKQRRMITLGDGTVDLQEWKVDRLADNSFEYHSYIGHNYNLPPKERLSSGAIWMLMQLTDPGSILETMQYRMGRTGLPGSGNDILQEEWDDRGNRPFYRYDQILQQFFNG